MDQQIFAHISFDGIDLLLPQSTVATVEMAGNIEASDSTTNAIGILRSSGKKWPVFALASDFSLFTTCPVSYKYCVAFEQDEEAVFALSCENVSSISVNQDVYLTPVQMCMRAPSCPIEALFLSDNQLMLVGGIGAIHSLLQPQALA